MPEQRRCDGYVFRQGSELPTLIGSLNSDVGDEARAACSRCHRSASSLPTTSANSKNAAEGLKA